MESSGFTDLLNTRTNNLYVEGFDDYVITQMVNMLCNEYIDQCLLFLHNFAYFSFFFIKTLYSILF